MAISKVEYLGGLSTKCIHLKSGSSIITDAPVDNNGKGEAFSPTDLVATSYASCMITIIGIYCDNHNINFVHCTALVNKIMVSGPRRIERIELEMDFSGNDWPVEVQKKIKIIGEACPVAKTVSSDVQVIFMYKF